MLVGSLGSLLLAGCASSGDSGNAVTGALPPADGKSPPLDGARPKAPAKKVAMLLPLSGATQHAAIAKSLKQAGELALFDRDDGSFQLVVLDDKGTPDGARAAADQAVKEGAELILGPLFSTSVAAAAPVARAAGVPVLAFSNDRQVAGSGVFLLGHQVSSEVERVVSYAVVQGRRRIAALIPDDPYGHLAESALRASAEQAGATVVALQRYPRSANGMLEPARQLANTLKELEIGSQPADTLFLPGDHEVLTQLASLLSYAGIDSSNMKILGTGAMDHPGLGRERLYVGAWFAAPDPRGWKQFSAQFSRTFGAAPPRIATLAYDSVGIAAELVRASGGGRLSAELLSRPQGFQSVDGQLVLSGAGLPVRSLAVLEVKDFSSIVVDAGGNGIPAAQASNTGARLN